MRTAGDTLYQVDASLCAASVDYVDAGVDVAAEVAVCFCVRPSLAAVMDRFGEYALDRRRRSL